MSECIISKRSPAHRTPYIPSPYGQIPEARYVCAQKYGLSVFDRWRTKKTCGNKRCVNPDHLEPLFFRDWEEVT